MSSPLLTEEVDFGTIDRIKLDFERPFWDPPGVHALWDEDIRDRAAVAAEPVHGGNWTRHVVGFDVVIKQPNMIMAWISGEPARWRWIKIEKKKKGGEFYVLLLDQIHGDVVRRGDRGVSLPTAWLPPAQGGAAPTPRHRRDQVVHQSIPERRVQLPIS